MKKYQWGERGDTTVTVLIAAALIAGAALVASGVIKFMRSESQFSHTSGSALAIESFLLSALQNANTYDATATTSMRNGNAPASLSLQMNRNGTNVLVATLGSATQLNEQGLPCAGAQCALKVNLSINCQSSVCRAAYRIEFNAATVKNPLPPLGASSWPPTPADFTQVISYDLYRVQQTNSVCSSPDLFVTGLNRNTAAVSCVGPTTITIQPNQIAKTMVFSPSTNSLEFQTITLAKGACPTKYIAQQLSTPSLEGTPSGTCVYRYKKKVPWFLNNWPSATESVNVQVCPLDYDAVGTGACTAVIVSQTNGYCPQTCTDGAGHSYDCSTHPPPDTANSVTYSTSGSNAICTLVKTGSGPCGASWVAGVEWSSGNCVLRLPETLPMGGGP